MACSSTEGQGKTSTLSIAASDDDDEDIYIKLEGFRLNLKQEFTFNFFRAIRINLIISYLLLILFIAYFFRII